MDKNIFECNYELSLSLARVADVLWGTLLGPGLVLVGAAVWVEPWLSSLRRRARAFAGFFGASAVSSPTVPQAVDRFSDNSHRLFGEEVNPALLSLVNSVRMEGTVGLVVQNGQ